MFLHWAGFSRASRNLIVALAAVPVLWVAAAHEASAQAPSIMAPGDTIVTAFPGIVLPNPPVAGDPTDETFIDLNGASMRIQRPQPPAPPSGQLIPSPTVFTALAQTVGEVFAVTLDDAAAPNIYLGATSAFGIQIVTPDSDGDGRPERVKTGQPDATFMDGQWGAGGTAGSIYRVDGTTGAITLFTTIGANTGPGLGDVVYDKASRQFFVSDLDTGLIYRLDWSGLLTDTFDHGINGRPSHGLAPAADDGSEMDITAPAFNSEDPATWGYTQPERMVWGMAMHNGRLFYAVTEGPQIWSVGINLDGTFANDARWELDVTGLASANPISDMLFDNQGRMYLAQRGPQRGSYDYSVFADPLTSSVVRYQREVPDDPTTPSTWVQVPEEYAIGFRPEGRNTNGGIALGYGHDVAGRMRTGACNQYLWTTGESLRDNPELEPQLAAGGPAIVHGLQGNDRDLVRPANDPPFSSYFTDYDGTFDDADNQGHIGDVEIWQPCQGQTYYFPPPTYIPPVFNLTITKYAVPDICERGGIGWLCGYTIRVTNTGSTIFWGPVTVDDWLPANPPGAIMHFFPEPPWVCGVVGPTHTQCTYPSYYLLPGESLDLYVKVELPRTTGLCYLTNVAKLTWPFGIGDSNPADDIAFATATIPNEQCKPPQGEKTNLRIKKQAYPYCWELRDAWKCGYLITVTNTGPGIYDGDIEVTDTLSVSTPIADITPPWTCVDAGPVHTCTYPAAHLNPWASVGLWFTTTIPKAPREQIPLCRVDNKVKITKAPGGSPLNVNPGDDTDSASAIVPNPNCRPPAKTDLSIKKEAKGCFQLTFNDRKVWACLFAIRVTNESGNNFIGPITIHDVVSPALPAIFAPACVAGGGGYNCNLPAVALAPHTSVLISAGVFVPDDGQVCHVRNTATITSPLGSPKNTNPGNDSSSATVDIPSERCQPILLRSEKIPNKCPFTLRMPGQGCCPEGQPWNGRSCGSQPTNTCPPDRQIPGSDRCCPAGTKWLGQACGTPPSDICPRDRQVPGSDRCCPAGTKWLGQSCGKPPSNSCPRDRQIPGDGCCPAGTKWLGQSCGTPPPSNTCPADRQIPGDGCCPGGTKWNGETCAAPPANTCPPDSHSTSRGCICNRGTHGIPGNCKPDNGGIVPLNPGILLVCPADSTGTFGNCRCKRGTHGTPGNCVPDTPILKLNPGILLLPACPSDSHSTSRGCICNNGTHGAPGQCTPNTAIDPNILLINPNVFAPTIK